jgi:hypothetical protein
MAKSAAQWSDGFLTSANSCYLARAAPERKEKSGRYSAAVWLAVSVAFTVLFTDLSHTSDKSW